MDYRNPLAKARDKWMESAEGKRMAEGVTAAQYLRNRLEVAFIAGWQAHEEEVLKADKAKP